MRSYTATTIDKSIIMDYSIPVQNKNRKRTPCNRLRLRLELPRMFFGIKAVQIATKNNCFYYKTEGKINLLFLLSFRRTRPSTTLCLIETLISSSFFCRPVSVTSIVEIALGALPSCLRHSSHWKQTNSVPPCGVSL